MASVSDATVNFILNDVYRELIQHVGDVDPAKVSATTTLAYTANAESVALPAAAALAKLVLIADVTNGQDASPLKELSTAEYHDYLETFQMPERIEEDYARWGFYIEGSNIYLLPKPGQAVSLRIVYVPNPSDFVSAADSPSLLPAQHHPLIALGAALQLAYELDVNTGLQTTYQMMYNRFDKWAREGIKSGARYVQERR